jgi:hypothetical protein
MKATIIGWLTNVMNTAYYKEVGRGKGKKRHGNLNLLKLTIPMTI